MDNPREKSSLNLKSRIGSFPSPALCGATKPDPYEITVNTRCLSPKSQILPHGMSKMLFRNSKSSRSGLSFAAQAEIHSLVAFHQVAFDAFDFSGHDFFDHTGNERFDGLTVFGFQHPFDGLFDIAAG